MTLVQEPFSRLLLHSEPVVNGGVVQRQVGRRIVERKRQAAANPDSPQGLASYFVRAMGDGWGDVNVQALRKMFSELIKDGRITAHQARAMVDRFVTDWKLVPHNKPAWQAFIGKRHELMGKTSDRKKSVAEKSDEWAELRERYLR